MHCPTNGMIGWWPFDGNANDLSPNGNDGTVYGAVLSPDRFGNPNMAYSFDGIDDYIDCNRDYQATFSFSIWFKTYVDQGYSPIIDAFDGHWEIQLKNNQPDYVSFVNPFNNYQEFISTTTVTSNVWHHLICTYNAGAVNFFINGQLTDQFTVLPLQLFGGTYNFGASLSGTDQFLNGTLDDIGIWDRTLTEEEVTSLHSGASTGDITIGEGLGRANGSVELYPNPANGRFNLMLEQMEGIVNAKVYDIQGREVWSDALVANGTHSQHSIDLTEQAKGIYTLQLQYSQGTLTRKLVKN
jgi:hypothetical protein